MDPTSAHQFFVILGVAAIALVFAPVLTFLLEARAERPHATSGRGARREERRPEPPRQIIGGATA